jgi:hypothetical protein
VRVILHSAHAEQSLITLAAEENICSLYINTGIFICIYIYLNTHIYTYTYIYTDTNMYIHINHIYIHLCTYLINSGCALTGAPIVPIAHIALATPRSLVDWHTIYINQYDYILLYTCICIYTYIRMYTYIYIYIYIYIYMYIYIYRISHSALIGRLAYYIHKSI